MTRALLSVTGGSVSLVRGFGLSFHVVLVGLHAVALVVSEAATVDHSRSLAIMAQTVPAMPQPETLCIADSLPEPKVVDSPHCLHIL